MYGLSGAHLAQDFFDGPHMVRQSARHRWRRLDSVRGLRQRLVRSAKIVVHEEQRDGMRVIPGLLAERVGEPREPTLAHANGEIGALDVGR
jgi:hypothetical protein